MSSIIHAVEYGSTYYIMLLSKPYLVTVLNNLYLSKRFNKSIGIVRYCTTISILIQKVTTSGICSKSTETTEVCASMN